MNLVLIVLDFWVNWFGDEWCYLSICLMTRSSSRWQAWQSQTGTSHSSLATPPSTVQPVVKAPWLRPRSAWHRNPRISFPWVLPPLPLLRAKPDRRAETCSRPRSPASGAGSRALGSSCPSKTAPAWPAASAELHQREPGIAGLSGRNAAVHTAIQITSGTPADPATASAQAYHEQTGVPIRTHSSLSLLSNVCFLLCGISIQTFGKLFFWLLEPYSIVGNTLANY